MQYFVCSTVLCVIWKFVKLHRNVVYRSFLSFMLKFYEHMPNMRVHSICWYISPKLYKYDYVLYLLETGIESSHQCLVCFWRGNPDPTELFRANVRLYFCPPTRTLRIDFYIIQKIAELPRRETGNDKTAVLFGSSDRNLYGWHDPETSKQTITSDRTQHNFAVHVARMS